METAGVVLAVLPLLINGLTGMAQAAETFHTLRTPGKQIGRYARKLKRELTLYRSTLMELLEGIAKSDDELHEMMLDTESPLWIKYDHALRRRLDQSYESFQDTVEEIEDELTTMIDKLKLKTDDANIQKNDEEFWTKEIRRAKMAFNKEAYQELCNHIRELNDFLSNATQASLRAEVKKSQRGPTGTKYSGRLKRLRDDAKNLHRTVTSEDSWKCACQHRVMLRMRPGLGDADIFPERWRLGVDVPKAPKNSIPVHGRQAPSITNRAGDNATSEMQSGQHARSVSVLQGKTKRSVKWQIPDDSSAISVVQVQMAGIELTNVRIENMCAALGTSQSRDLGFLEAKDGTWRCGVKYKSRERSCHSASNIGQLLQQNSEKGSAACVVFSRRERLAAAATLAFSVLFLDGSWLKTVWTSDDILLVRDADMIIDKFGTENPTDESAFSWLVCSSDGVDPEIEHKCRELKKQRKIAVLFALAMALIELSLGEPLNKLKVDEERCENFVSGNVAAASRLLPRVQDASGFEYSEAVRKCLDCPFDIREPSMDNETFLGVYFDEIARPLMSDYERFIGLK
ncbi:hypothetical protein LTR24_008671 [Lithohypha guttulata]|uniref:DUF7580 domain-containing protein n=1 Tax=Lithohypha guttulata TaxID=1690604 RepID=A0ABR0JZB9_9EURO|nr:hypothetical protein LTR24_008671 [Lithohypha guttulata]